MAMRYSAGMLRDRVELLEPLKSRDAIGGVTLDYKPAGEVYASIKPLTAREVLTAEQARPEITHRVVIRWNSTRQIAINWRVRLGVRTFEVAAPPIDVDERHRYLQLLCKEAG